MRVSLRGAVWGWIVRVLEGMLSRARARLTSEQSTRERDAALDAGQREFDPPAHWLEHATPRPPADWVRMVAEKAPHLLDRVDPRYVRSILKAPPVSRSQADDDDSFAPTRPAYRVGEVTTLPAVTPMVGNGRETARRARDVHDPTSVTRQTADELPVKRVPAAARNTETVAHIESNPPISLPLATAQRRAYVPFVVHEHTARRGAAAHVQPITTTPDQADVQAPRATVPHHAADVQSITTAPDQSAVQTPRTTIPNPAAHGRQLQTVAGRAAPDHTEPEFYPTRPLETEHRTADILTSQPLESASVRAAEGKWASLPDMDADPVESPDTVRRHRAKLDSEQRGVADFWNE